MISSSCDIWKMNFENTLFKYIFSYNLISILTGYSGVCIFYLPACVYYFQFLYFYFLAVWVVQAGRNAINCLIYFFLTYFISYCWWDLSRLFINLFPLKIKIKNENLKNVWIFLYFLYSIFIIHFSEMFHGCMIKYSL